VNRRGSTGLTATTLGTLVAKLMIKKRQGHPFRSARPSCGPAARRRPEIETRRTQPFRHGQPAIR
jgi:hypothetical protein